MQNRRDDARGGEGARRPVRAALLRLLKRRPLSRTRLRGDVVALRHEYELRPDRETCRKELEALLEAAEQEALWGSVHRGYAAYGAARRVALHAHDLDGLRAEADAVRAESRADKLSTWRREAIQDLLEPVTAAPAVASTSEEVQAGSNEEAQTGSGDSSGSREPEPRMEELRARLHAAMEIRDEGVQGNHRKRHVLTTRFATLTLVAAAGLLLLWRSDTPVVADGDVSWFVIFLFGLLGGCVSAGARLGKNRASATLPEVLRTTLSTLFLPVFGGVAAIGAVALLTGGLIQGMEGNEVLAVAFLAGFSERFVSGLAEL